VPSLGSAGWKLPHGWLAGAGQTARRWAVPLPRRGRGGTECSLSRPHLLRTTGCSISSHRGVQLCRKGNRRGFADGAAPGGDGCQRIAKRREEGREPTRAYVLNRWCIIPRPGFVGDVAQSLARAWTHVLVFKDCPSPARLSALHVPPWQPCPPLLLPRLRRGAAMAPAQLHPSLWRDSSRVRCTSWGGRGMADKWVTHINETSVWEATAHEPKRLLASSQLLFLIYFLESYSLQLLLQKPQLNQTHPTDLYPTLVCSPTK